MIGQGRASELLYTGRAMTAEEGASWGFFNALHESGALMEAAAKLAAQLAAGPTFAHGVTKKLLHQEWNMGVDEAIEAEAEAQACLLYTSRNAWRWKRRCATPWKAARCGCTTSRRWA